MSTKTVKLKGAKILKPQDIRRVQSDLPKSWTNGIGILKGVNIDPLAYQKQIRKGWSKRMKRTVKTGRA